MELKNLREISKGIIENHKNFVVEDVNNHCLRMAINEDTTFPWHSHPNSSELFVVLEGNLIIEFEDGESASLFPNDFLSVPAGRVHRTIAKGRTVNLCFESIDAETNFKS
jgi:mannose-6-phosphate isomerase-like protein (cupin superfamily)